MTRGKGAGIAAVLGILAVAAACATAEVRVQGDRPGQMEFRGVSYFTQMPRLSVDPHELTEIGVATKVDPGLTADEKVYALRGVDSSEVVVMRAPAGFAVSEGIPFFLFTRVGLTDPIEGLCRYYIEPPAGCPQPTSHSRRARRGAASATRRRMNASGRATL